MNLNLRKLNGKIVESGIKKQAVAEYFGISIQALNKKLTGETRITVDDACKFCEVLKIDSDREKSEIFLL